MSKKDKDKSPSGSPVLIRFDWAMKRLLRNKANYRVLEGFLSVLLKEEDKIISIKESESNKASAKDRFNRVDILVENRHGELLIIEMQNSEEVDYFLRMLYAVSKTISEHIFEGEHYSKVRKIYHINIVYFKIGEGKDYVYHGTTEFRGIHKNDILQLTEKQFDSFIEAKRYNVNGVKDLFPEYYVLCVRDFDDVALDGLDEWIYYFKNNFIPDEFSAPGLKEAREELRYDKLSEDEKLDYKHHLKQWRYEKNAIETSKNDGIKEGLAQGEAERVRLESELEQKNQTIAQKDQDLEAAQKLADNQAARIAELEKMLNRTNTDNNI